MDAKWLRVYERTALYGETLEITDYSPEIDTELKIVRFPTFPGPVSYTHLTLPTIRLV